MNGYGVYIYRNGVRYEGIFKNDLKDGFGNYTWADGSMYIGQWSQGKQHGIGIYKVSKNRSPKYGLWEFGNFLKWVNKEKVNEFQKRNYDIYQEFENPKAIQHLNKLDSFLSPTGFDQ